MRSEYLHYALNFLQGSWPSFLIFGEWIEWKLEIVSCSKVEPHSELEILFSSVYQSLVKVFPLFFRYINT